LRVLFRNTIHVFEDLDKEDLVSRKRAKKVRRKRNARTPWRRIHRRMSEVALTAHADPRNTSRECSIGCRKPPTWEPVSNIKRSLHLL
jgi:putative transposase